jgi:anti-sigma-K factor RskA
LWDRIAGRLAERYEEDPQAGPSTPEVERVERHLRTCPRCRAEVDAHYETAAAMGNTVEPVSPELWDRIAGRLAERYEEDPQAGPSTPEAPVPATASVPPWLASVASHGAPQEDAAGPTADAGPPPVADLARERRQRQHRRGLSRRIMSVAVAAAVVVGVLAVDLDHRDSQVSQLQSALAAKGDSAAVEAALANPHHQVVRMRSPGGAQLAEFVVVPGGHGYLWASTMPELPGGETYQLWAAVDGQFISLGLLGSHPQSASFTESGTSPSQLAITVEPAGGVVTPDHSPVATGNISLA